MSKWMERARAGDVAAMALLADCYYSGRGGIGQDFGEALAWYGKAAAKGHVGALVGVGVMHEYGQGTRVNLLNALNYYQQAKDKDSTARPR